MNLPKFRGFSRLVRLSQFHKNFLVFFGAIGSSQAYTIENFATLGLTAVAFFLISSLVYIINDAVDRDEDRYHAKKKDRPIASGEISIKKALSIGSCLALAGIVVLARVNELLLVVVSLYIAINLLYTFYLREKILWDILAVASGFPLRAIAGSLATQIVPSISLISLVFFGSLMLVCAKRKAQLLNWQTTHQGRRVLMQYSHTFLNSVIVVSASVCFTSYINLLTEFPGSTSYGYSVFLFNLSLIPFCITLLLLIFQALKGSLEYPELFIIKNRITLVWSLIWLIVFIFSRYEWTPLT